MNELNRTLDVLVDGVSIADGCRVRLMGEAGLGLYPRLVTVSMLNISESGYHAIRMNGRIAVRCGDSELFSGEIQDVNRETVKGGVWTTVGFAAGVGIYREQIGISLEAGLTASETVQTILQQSQTGIRLLSWRGEDPVFSRAQAYCGSTAEIVEQVMAAAGAMTAMVDAGIIVATDKPEATDVWLTEADLMNEPYFTAEHVVLQTKMVGWTVGHWMQLDWQDKTIVGLIEKRAVEADTGKGIWTCELMIRTEG